MRETRNFALRGCFTLSDYVIAFTSILCISIVMLLEEEEYSYEIVDDMQYFESIDALFCGGENMLGLYWKVENARTKTTQMCTFDSALTGVSSVIMNKFDRTIYTC